MLNKPDFWAWRCVRYLKQWPVSTLFIDSIIWKTRKR